VSTVITRRVASTPNRTASATWAKIASLLAPDAKGDARQELMRVSGVASSSIASEATKTDPIVVYGGGPRVRVYCAFNDDAITGDGVSEDALPRSPTGDGWRLSIPFPEEDMTWAKAELARLSSKVTARAAGAEVSEEAASTSQGATSVLATVDTEEFYRP